MTFRWLALFNLPLLAIFDAGMIMLRILVEPFGYSLSVEEGVPTRQIYAEASIPEGIDVNGSRFSGPVHVVVSDKAIEPPFQHGSIFWDVDAYGSAFASLWLHAPSEIIDRIADRTPGLRQLSVFAKGALVNGGIWPEPTQPAEVSKFCCDFGPIPGV